VCLRSAQKIRVFHSVSNVHFRDLSSNEITYYIEKYQPFDKAGAYGIQEWIGYIGIEKIEGSFYNVMGLPVQTLYNELEEFIVS
jgi:septum formation protein